MGLGVAIAALALGGCGSSDVQYVKNSKAGVFLKVPKAWTVYTLAKGNPMELGTKPVANGSRAVADPPTPWLVGLDLTDKPSRADFDESVPRHPIGMLEVLPKEALGGSIPPSFQAIAGIALNTPNGEPVDASTYDGVQQYEELELPSGHFGMRFVYTDSSSSQEMKTLRIVLVDPKLQRVYALILGCESSCFEDNEAAITKIADSLTLEAR